MEPEKCWDGVLDDGALRSTSQEVRALRKYPAEYANAYAAVQRLAGETRSGPPGVEFGEKHAERGRRQRS